MTKAELIEAMKDFSDDCLILMPSYEDDGYGSNDEYIIEKY